MKKAIIAAFLATVPAWAVGTCNVSNASGQASATITVACTGDASTGSFPATAITGLAYPLSLVEIVPGGTAPTAGFSVTVTDANGADQLSGQATNLGASGTQAYSVSASKVPSGNLTLNITGNAVASALVTVWLYSSTTPAFPGRHIAEKGTRWAVFSTPAAGTQATVSRAAIAGVRHVADCVTLSAGSIAAPAAGTQLSVNLRDGASGAGTALWTALVFASTSAVQGIGPVSVCGLNLIGSPNTAMTLEFSSLLANLFESVSLSGYDLE